MLLQQSGHRVIGASGQRKNKTQCICPSNLRDDPKGLNISTRTSSKARMSGHNHPGFACLRERYLALKTELARSFRPCYVRTLADLGNMSLSDLSQLVESIQGGHFVSLGQSGVVKDHIAEVFDRSAVEEHRLTDMNNFGCALS